MVSLPDPIIFEWDSGNVDKNWDKHRITNKEAEEAFNNKPVFIFKDEKHSSSLEERYMVWGTTNEKKELSIIFTIRENKIRVISARDMNKKEKRSYEEKIQTNS